MKFIKNLKKIIFVLFCGILSLSVGFFCSSSSGEVSASVPTSGGYVNVGNLLVNNYENKSDGNYIFEGTVLDDLYKKLGGTSATFTTIKNLAPTISSALTSSSGSVSSATFRSKNGNKDVLLTLGGIVWTPVELFKDANGDVCLALLQKDVSTTNYAFSNYANDSSTVAYPSNMYGISKIRVQALNNGGSYATSTSQLGSNNAISTTHTYAKFTSTAASGSIVKYLVKASDTYMTDTVSKWIISYNSSSAISSALLARSFNDSLNAPSQYSYNNNVKTYYYNRTYANNWKDDYVILPSLYETGRSASGSSGSTYQFEGRWRLSSNQYATSKQYWLRTCQNELNDTKAGQQIRRLDGTGKDWNYSGTSTNNVSTNNATTVGVRPCIFLNLTDAEANKAYSTTTPSNVSGTYTGSPLNTSKYETTANGWYNSSKVTVTYDTSRYDYTNVGTHYATVTTKNGYYFGADGSATSKSVALTISKASVTAPVNRSYVYDGNQHKFESESWFNSAAMEIVPSQSDYNYTDSRVYEATIRLKSANYYFSGLSQNLTETTATISITKKQISAPSNSTITYDGSKHEFEKMSWYDSSLMTLSYDTNYDFTSAGTYNVVVSLPNDNYRWSSADNKTLTVTLVIESKEITPSNLSVVYDSEEHKNDVTRQVWFTSNTAYIDSIEYENKNFIDAGEYEFTVKLSNPNIVFSANKNVRQMTFKLTISKKKVNVQAFNIDPDTGLLATGEVLKLSETIYTRDEGTDRAPTLALEYSNDRGTTWTRNVPTHAGAYIAQGYITNESTSNYVLDNTARTPFTKSKGLVYMPRFYNEDIKNNNHGGTILPRTIYGWTTQIQYTGNEQVFKLLKIDGSEPARINVDSVSGGLTYDSETGEFRVTNVGVYTAKISVKDPANEQWDNYEENTATVRTITLEILKAEVKYEIVDDGQNSWESGTIQTIVINFNGVSFADEATRPKITVLQGLRDGALASVSEDAYTYGANTLSIAVDISNYQPEAYYEINVLLDETIPGNNNYYLVSTGKTLEGTPYEFFIMTAVIKNLKIEWLYSNSAISTGISANPAGETFTYNTYAYDFRLNEMLLPSGIEVVYNDNEKTDVGTFLTIATLTSTGSAKFDSNVVAIDPTTSEASSDVIIVTNGDGTVTVKINWAITPMTYEIRNIQWLEDFTYNQLRQVMDIVSASLPNWITKTSSNGTNYATNPGEYTAKYMLTADSNHIFANSDNNPLIEIQSGGKTATVSHVWNINKIVINVSNLSLDWKFEEHYDENLNWFESPVPTSFDKYSSQLIITYYTDSQLTQEIGLNEILVTLGEEVWFYAKVELKADANVTDYYELKNTSDSTLAYATQMFKVGDIREVIDLTLSIDSNGVVYNGQEQKLEVTYPRLNLDGSNFNVKYYKKGIDGSYSEELVGEFPKNAGEYLAVISFVDGSVYEDSYNIRNKRFEFEIHKLVLSVASWTDKTGLEYPEYDVFAKNSDETNLEDFFTYTILIASTNTPAVMPLQYNKLYIIVLSSNDESVEFDTDAEISHEFRTGLDPALNYVKLEVPEFVNSSLVWNNSELTFEIADWDNLKNYLEITSDSDSLTQTDAKQYQITLRFKANAEATWTDGTSGDLNLIFSITKRTIEKPITTPEEGILKFEFNGLNAEYFPMGFDEEWMTIEGNVIEALGNGTMTIKLLDPENMEWTDGTNDDLTDIAFEVVARGFDVPIVLQVDNKSEYIYSGNIIEFDELNNLLNFNSNFMLISGDLNGTNAGEYTITISLIYKDYTFWKVNNSSEETLSLFVSENESTEDIVLEWEIFKAPITGEWNTENGYPVFVPENESVKDLYSVKYYAVDENGNYILDSEGNKTEINPENFVDGTKYKAEIVLNDSDNYEVIGDENELIETEKEFEYKAPVPQESFINKLTNFVKKYWLWLLIALIVLIILIIIIVVAKKRKKKKEQEVEEKAKAEEQQNNNPYNANFNGQPYMQPPYPPQYPPYAGQPPMFYGGMQGYAQPQTYGQQVNGYDAVQDKKLQELEDKINILSGEKKPENQNNSIVKTYDEIQDAKLKEIEEKLAKLDGTNATDPASQMSSHDELQDKKLQEIEERLSKLSQSEDVEIAKTSDESLSDYDKLQDEKLQRIEKQLNLLQKENITQSADELNNISSQDIEKFMMMLVQSYKNTKRSFNEDFENMINNRSGYDAGNWDKLKENERKADEEYNKERQRLEKIRDDIKLAEMEKAQKEIEEQKKVLEKQRKELEELQQTRQAQLDAKLKDAKQRLEEMDVRIQKQEAEAKKREEARQEAEKKKEEQRLKALREERIKAEKKLQELKLENKKSDEKKSASKSSNKEHKPSAKK